MDHHNPEVVMQCKVCEQVFRLHEEYRFDAYTNAYHLSCVRETEDSDVIGSAHYQGSVLLDSVYFKGYITSEPPLYYAKGMDHSQEHYLYTLNQTPDCRNYSCKRHPLHHVLKKND